MPDYTSRVPKYAFPGTLEDQEAALATNPLMQRLIEYRKSYAGDPHRPLCHYVNSEAMLNDPKASAVGRGAGICSTRPIRPKIQDSTGGTRSRLADDCRGSSELLCYGTICHYNYVFPTRLETFVN